MLYIRSPAVIHLRTESFISFGQYLHLSLQPLATIILFSSSVSLTSLTYTWDHTWVFAFSSFDYIPKSRIAGLYGSFGFNFLRNYVNCFPQQHHISHFSQQCTRIPISSPPHQHLLFSGFFIVAIPAGMTWVLVVLTCFSLIHDVEHLFSFAYWLSIFFGEMFRSFVHYLMGLVFVVEL